MSWFCLVAAILFEISGTTSMKFSEGFSKILPSIMVFLCYGAAIAFMNLAMRKIEMSVVYTIWAGVGTALIALIGIFYFGEQATVLKIVSILLIISGVIGLKISAN